MLTPFLNAVSGRPGVSDRAPLAHRINRGAGSAWSNRETVLGTVWLLASAAGWSPRATAWQPGWAYGNRRRVGSEPWHGDGRDRACTACIGARGRSHALGAAGRDSAVALRRCGACG